MNEAVLSVDNASRKRTVPGAGLTARDIYRLAESYHQAAEALEKKPRGWTSENPIRFLYYQALENYLRAFLRLHGKEPEELRTYMHDFAYMLDHCVAAGLSVRAKTIAFVRETVVDSDYVRVRYELELVVPSERRGLGVPGKELARLVAATNELRRKMPDALVRSGITPPETASRLN